MISNSRPRREDFPASFRWGVSTSAYQIEGALDADGRGASIWDVFSKVHTSGGDAAARGIGHFDRWADDLQAIADLGVNAYRLSIGWPRILPEGRGRVNAAGLAFYDRIIDATLAKGLEPWVTLYHWDLPLALQEQGGWCNRETSLAFAEFSSLIVGHFGDRVKHWVTHNEPWCAAHLGHATGLHAPGLKDLKMSLQAAHELLVSHGLAIQAIRAHQSDAKVGIVLNLMPGHALTDTPQDIAAARYFDGQLNRWYLDPLFGRGYPADMLELYGEAAPEASSQDLQLIAEPTDFIGVNYYARAVIEHAPDEPLRFQWHDLPDAEYMDNSNMPVYPDGLREICVRLHQDYGASNIVITENGGAFEDVVEPSGAVHDAKRQSFLERHVDAMRSAIEQSAPVTGYFVWSAFDVYEWNHGYGPRLGLIHVDFATLERRIKDSGRWYSEFLKPKS